MQFLQFYFQKEQITSITNELFVNLNYCDISSKKIYFYLLEKFNALKILGNLNQSRSYWKFLKNYLRGFSTHQYINTEELWMLDSASEPLPDVEYVTKCILISLKKKLVTLSHTIQLSMIQEEISILIQFVEKNLKLIHAEKSFSPPDWTCRTQTYSHLQHQEEFDRLNGLQLPRTELLKEIEKSYCQNRISAYEINQLSIWKEIDKE